MPSVTKDTIRTIHCKWRTTRCHLCHGRILQSDLMAYDYAAPRSEKCKHIECLNLTEDELVPLRVENDAQRVREQADAQRAREARRAAEEAAEAARDARIADRNGWLQALLDTTEGRTRLRRLLDKAEFEAARVREILDEIADDGAPPLPSNVIPIRRRA